MELLPRDRENAAQGEGPRKAEPPALVLLGRLARPHPATLPSVHLYRAFVWHFKQTRAGVLGMRWLSGRKGKAWPWA